MSVDVVVPLQGNCPHRRAAWEWVRDRYAVQHPDWRLCLAEGVRSHAGVDPNGLDDGTAPRFSKGALVNPEIEGSGAEIVIVADADVWTDGLAAAVDAVREGAPFAVPHDEVHRLTEEGTAAVLAGDDWRGQPLCPQPYPGMLGGGFVVARRETLLEIPMDPRFINWGQEDQAFGIALHHSVGMRWRGHADLVHLWHPEPERLSRKWGSIDSRALLHRYIQARSDPMQMKALIEEAKDFSHRTDKSSLHGHQPIGID